MKVSDLEKLALQFRALDDEMLAAYAACLFHEYAGRNRMTVEDAFIRLAQIAQLALGDQFYMVPSS